MATTATTAAPTVQRAILISFDGMHALDLALHVKTNPGSHLASLMQRGVTYTNARQPLLGDSSPGLLSFATGGSPLSTGIIYSPTYDRSLSPRGSDCKTRGTILYIDEKSVFDFTKENSGGGIDPSKLPRDPDRGCAPVYPHQLQRVNNIFEVVKQSGGRTAWIDQHLMYSDMLRGPSGQGLYDSALIVITSKHGQSPIDIKQRRIVDRNVLRGIVNGVQPGLLAHAAMDTIGIVWLTDSSKTAAVAAALRTRWQEAGIHKVYAGEELAMLLDPPDARTPDLIVQPMPGTFYAEAADSPPAQALLSEHGGMLDEDVVVPLVASFPGAPGSVIRSPVLTSQIAPTVLSLLGLDPSVLKAVRQEHTAVLPGLKR